jgi:hypothetical protein
LCEECSGQDERAAQERHGHDGHHKRAGGADGAPEHLRPQVRQPRAVVMPPGPVRDGCRVDPLVQVRRGRRRRQAAEQRQQARGPADLGRAGRALLHVGREARGVVREEVVHEERVDQAVRSGVIEGPAGGRRLAHIL